MDIFQRVNDLHLPLGQYVVFGAGPMAAYGIRPTQDVDLFVTDALYEELKRSGWEEKLATKPHDVWYLALGIYEANNTWCYGEYRPTPEALIATAELIHGLPFAPLTEVLKWKQAFARPKDLADVKLIEAYLEAKP